MREEGDSIAIPERSPVSVDEVSADLAFELQAKFFEQLATLSVAGAGLVITLRGSILAGASPMIWMGAIEFGLAALVALTAQFSLIESLFSRKFSRRSIQIMAMISVVLLGMAIGTVGASVVLEGAPPPTAAPA